MKGTKDMIGTSWMHIRTGNVYTIVGECQMEATWEPGVLYVRANGSTKKPIARALAEFTDGRFEQIEITA
jgi:hypothetical protein